MPTSLTHLLASPYSLTAYLIVALLLLAFLLLAYRDLALLFVSRGTLSAGRSRIWAVARTAILEAWAGRVWALPLLWFAACFIINLFVSPYDEQDRIAIYLRVFLTAQELLALIFLGILAAFSFPKERERRTVINTASKPLSRLEYFLGKALGFSVTAAALLLIMGLTTWAYIYVADLRVRSREAAAYAKEVIDYQADPRTHEPPSEGLKYRAAHGVLAAHNFVTPRSMQIAGYIDYDSDPPLRFLKGGSQEHAIFRFQALNGPANFSFNPSFMFNFFAQRLPSPAHPDVPPPPLPPTIQIDVTLTRQNNPAAGGTEEATLTLQRTDPTSPVYVYRWIPSRREEFFGLDNPADPDNSYQAGPLDLQVSCPTRGVYLYIRDLTQPADTNVWADTAYGGARIAVSPLAAPRLLGFERNNFQQIQGPDDRGATYPEVASFRFAADDLNDIPINHADDTFTITFDRLDVDKTANQSKLTFATVTAYNRLMTRSGHWPSVTTAIAEKRVTTVALPASLLARDQKSGRVVADLFLDLRCDTPGHWLGLNVDSVHIEQPPGLFVVNLFKSELVIFLEVALLVLIAVAAGIRLGGPVAVLLTATAYLLASLFSFVHQQLLSGGESIFSVPEQKMLAGNWLYKSGVLAQGAAMKLAYFFINMLPDFNRYQPLDYLVASRNMPWSVLGMDALWTLLYSIPFIALGYLLIRKQELG